MEEPYILMPLEGKRQRPRRGNSHDRENARSPLVRHPPAAPRRPMLTFSTPSGRYDRRGLCPQRPDAPSRKTSHDSTHPSAFPRQDTPLTLTALILRFALE